MQTQTQQEIKPNEAIIIHLIKVLQENPRISFRQLLIISNLSPQNIWDTLRYLQKKNIAEPIKLSRSKTAWQLQRWFIEARENVREPYTTDKAGTSVNRKEPRPRRNE